METTYYKHKTNRKIGFGGGCHWCTEAVFQSLKGVEKVEQGWIASVGANSHYSEAVIVHFDQKSIDVESLIAIHLFTHSCTSKHSKRDKYRSSVYTFSEIENKLVEEILNDLQSSFDKPILTEVLPFVSFKKNKEKYQEYYLKNPENQFCQRYIKPKLQMLLQKHSKHVKKDFIKS